MIELSPRFLEWVWIVWFATVAAQGQDRSLGTAEPPLVNSGTPMRVPFQCTEADMQWAGMSCSREDPCPVYLELTAVESVGSQLFATGNIHAETVTLDSVLLGSDDGGKTWREPSSRIRGAGLDHLQFVDFANGWASGEMLSPLPQDPFLLITQDGGKSWRRSAIFAETQVGSIQQFFFSSENDGSLVIDRGQGSETERYQRYETATGGATWTVKESSNRAIRMKDAPAETASWRVRADGQTQSFRIEHRQGERWEAATAFAVNLGACAPEPSDPTAAPEPRPTPDQPLGADRPARGAPKK